MRDSDLAELRRPAAQALMGALKSRPLDHKGLAKTVGLGLPAVRTFITRLIFLGMVERVHGDTTYRLTEEGRTALAGLGPKPSLLGAVQAIDAARTLLR